jgi:hypothetical protein
MVNEFGLPQTHYHHITTNTLQTPHHSQPTHKPFYSMYDEKHYSSLSKYDNFSDYMKAKKRILEESSDSESESYVVNENDIMSPEDLPTELPPKSNAELKFEAFASLPNGVQISLMKKYNGMILNITDKELSSKLGFFLCAGTTQKGYPCQRKTTEHFCSSHAYQRLFGL